MPFIVTGEAFRRFHAARDQNAHRCVATPLYLKYNFCRSRRGDIVELTTGYIDSLAPNPEAIANGKGLVKKWKHPAASADD